MLSATVECVDKSHSKVALDWGVVKSSFSPITLEECPLSRLVCDRLARNDAT